MHKLKVYLEIINFLIFVRNKVKLFIYILPKKKRKKKGNHLKFMHTFTQKKKKKKNYAYQPIYH